MNAPMETGSETEAIDDQARKAYGARIEELQQEIAQAEINDDLMRVEGLGRELDQLVEHFSKAMGLGGRTRRINPTHERARAAVTWRIRAAIRKIAAAHPSLGRHPENAVKTGSRCIYAPEKPLTWAL